MQKDASQLPASVPLASNTSVGGGREATMSGVSSKNETKSLTSSKSNKKPTISKVILKIVTDKGARNRVSLATLKKTVATMGYNVSHSTYHFKRALKGLVDKGMLQQVTGKGASGSFRLGKKGSKSKLKVKRRQQRRRAGRRRIGQRRAGYRRSGQRRSGQRRLLLGSKQGHKRLFKRARGVAKCRCN
ncbi:spermatid-specific linker histone H1-like protein [Nycticebus coucang]|uniref:spermatid-specific linker histone H1-like protein n=1 Tax=Nycticebus coucang TaxID=9470 RepID=UPI00234D365D|nr:spermatid-specific linker histone H1-like protein [Nycticebus coucang]